MKFVDFKEKKRFSDQYLIPALNDIGQTKKAKNLKCCGDFKDVAICEDCHTIYFDKAYYCRDRFCPVCNKARSLLWFSKLRGILPKILSHSKEYKLDLITFTIRDTDDLKDGINLIQKAFRYMMHDEKGIAKQFNSIIIGGLRALEVKRGKYSNKWHPHFHVLCIKKGKSNNFEFLRTAWEHSLNVVADLPGKLGSVDVKYLEHNIDKGICETIKYLTKTSFEDKNGNITINTSDLAEMIKVLPGVRSLTAFGCLRYYLSEESIEEDMALSNQDQEARCCKYCGCSDFITIEKLYSRYMLFDDFEECNAG